MCVQSKIKVVGSVGTRLSGEPVSPMWQGIELFPHMLMSSGYKVGTMGNKRPNPDVVPTCSLRFCSVVGTNNPCNGAG